MADPDGVIVYLATYGDLEDARADFEGFEAVHKEKWLGEYEAALFGKEADGKLKIYDTVASERGWGAKVGAITGATIGLLFPPAIVASAIAGAGVGAVAGQLKRGMKTDDIKAMAEMLEEGTYGIVLVGFTTVEEGAERFLKRAAKVMKQEVDAQAEEIKKSIDEAAQL
jgi:uncharacterized membrane protein